MPTCSVPLRRSWRASKMQSECLTGAPAVARAPKSSGSVGHRMSEVPAYPQKETTLRRGPFLGYYREERYVCCLWEVTGTQAPSGRLNRVEAVSAICAKPNPAKKTAAM